MSLSNLTETINSPSRSSEHTTESYIHRDFRLFITTESGSGRLIPGKLKYLCFTITFFVALIFSASKIAIDVTYILYSFGSPSVFSIWSWMTEFNKITIFIIVWISHILWISKVTTIRFFQWDATFRIPYTTWCHSYLWTDSKFQGYLAKDLQWYLF